MARREKKPVHKVVMTEGKRNIIQQLLQEYDIETAEDIQDVLKDLLGGTIKEMMEAEMDDHLGYQKSERSDSDDYRNGYKSKRVNSSYGSMDIDVPQDRKSTFEPQIVKKRQKDISDIDQKIISMYAKGMTTRQISETIEDIYGFETSEGFISDVTDKILPQIEDWQNRPLDEVLLTIRICLFIFLYICIFNIYYDIFFFIIVRITQVCIFKDIFKFCTAWLKGCISQTSTNHTSNYRNRFFEEPANTSCPKVFNA
jgi:predicted DNA-binding antitoxin AbrB/MazE fold protein